MISPSEVGTERYPDCDAGQGACGQRSVVHFGRVALCQDHLDVLETGQKRDAAAAAVHFVRRWLAEGKVEATEFLEPRLAGILGEAERELENASADHAHFLEKAGDAE